MIKLSIRIASQVLYRPVTVTVALPYAMTVGNGPFKVVYALHPAIESGDIFFEKLGLADNVDKYAFALVAPDLGNSYFLNTPYERQADFLRMELMPVLTNMLPLSSQREDNMLFGISMGAFGAARWALSSPEHFRAAALVSGIFDASLPIDERARKNREQRPIAKLFGDRIMPLLTQDKAGNVYPEADIRPLYAQAALKQAPSFALWHGDTDYLSTNQSEDFVSRCEAHGIPVQRQVSDGAHNLLYWKRVAPEALAWLLDIR